MKRSLPKTIFRVFAWVIMILLAILLLVFALLQVPAVQQRVAKEVEKIAASSLGTDVGIGSMDLDFPTRLELEDIYVNNPAGDSIARVGHLGVGINMLSLINKEIDITDVILRDVYANAVTTDSTSNIQFLLDLAAVDSSAVDTSSSSVTVNTADTTAASGGWRVAAAGAKLLLERADIYYQDDPAGLLVDLDARKLEVEMNDVDLENQLYDINYADLEGTNAIIGIGESSTPTDTTATEAAAMTLRAGRLTIQETTFGLSMDSLDIGTDIPYVNLEGAELLLGEELAFNGEVFQLRDFAFSMDTPAPELDGPGMDYGHLALTDVQAEATDIAYIVDSLAPAPAPTIRQRKIWSSPGKNRG